MVSRKVDPQTTAGLNSESHQLDRIAIVAGGGQIPLMLAQSLSQRGEEPFIAMLRGDANEALSRYEHIYISSASIGILIAEIKKRRIEKIVLVGSVKGRPKWSDFRPDITTLKIVSRIIKGLGSGDDALLSQLVKVIEDAGIQVVGVHDVMPELLAGEGIIAGPKPGKAVMTSIDIGIKAATALGKLDAGQACVVIGRRIVALEGVEGTDEMLLRVADMRKRGKLSAQSGGVLVKLCKPQQDKRVDMPTIGPSTIQNVNAAGLKGIAIHAHNTLIADAELTCSKADQHNIFICGVEPAVDG